MKTVREHYESIKRALREHYESIKRIKRALWGHDDSMFRAWWEHDAKTEMIAMVKFTALWGGRMLYCICSTENV